MRADNYSLVIDIGADGSTLAGLQLKVMDIEGSKRVISVSNDSAVKTAGGYHIGDIVTYTTNSEGKAIVAVEKAFNGGDLQTITGSHNKAGRVLTSGRYSWPTADNCVLFADITNTTPTAGDTFKAYNIHDLEDLTNSDLPANKWTMVTNANDEVIVVVSAMGREPGDLDITNYGYIVSDSYQVTRNGTIFTQFELWNGFENVTVTEEKPAKYRAGTAISYKMTSNGLISEIQVISETGAVTAISGENIEILSFSVGRKAYTLDENTAILYINSNTYEGYEGSTIQLATQHFDNPIDNSYDQNVIYKVGADGMVDAIFVDVNNKLSGTTLVWY